MPRRHTVDQLPDDQLQFVIDRIIDGETDREISLHFEDKFKTKLPKSSLARWRKAAGDQLAENFRLARYTAKQFIEDAKLDPEVDKYQVFLESVEDRLLTATREVHAQDPFKLVLIQQEEKRRQLGEEKLKLDREKLALERERVHGVALDRVKLGEEFSSDLLEYIGSDVEGLTWFRKHIKLFNDFIQQKHAEAKA